jgi:Fe-S cluster assembly scaffold protein SufB
MRFYLLARGLDADTARALLEWAFVEDALAGFDPPALRAAAERQLAEAIGSQVARQLLAAPA